MASDEVNCAHNSPENELFITDKEGLGELRRLVEGEQLDGDG